MNIFVTDFCPVKSAQSLPDKHIVKMPLETCQMLSIILSSWYFDWGHISKKDGTPYNTEKGAFRNHPCTVWASKTYENLAWLITHGIALCEEYTRRYNKQHSCLTGIREAELIFKEKTGLDLSIHKNASNFVRAMPDDLKLDDTISTPKAYQIYIVSKIWTIKNYKDNNRPNWMVK